MPVRQLDESGLAAAAAALVDPLTTATTKVAIEAKQGWIVPRLTQYRGRFGGFETGLLISLSDSSEIWARDQLPAAVGGVPVRLLPRDALR